MNTRILSGAAIAAMAMVAAPAQAAYYSTTVILNTTSPTYHPLENGIPPVALSGSESALPYQLLAFTVSESGSYSLGLSTSGGFMPYLALYSPTFIADAPLTNALAANHFTGALQFGTSLNYNLLAGTNYVAVLSGVLYAAAGAGPYTGSYLGVFGVNGPGTLTPGAIAAVPEPASWGMMLLGFGAMGAAMRRRSKVSVRLHLA